MASASCLLSEEQFLCSICLDVFTNPVTIPCGHNFCKTCITQHWDSNVLCRCPNCNNLFNTRPELQVNTFISEMAAQFRKSVQVKSNSCPDQQCAKPGEVPCDVCTETMIKAVKSCLVCLASYCETHLEPHQRVERLKRHKLIDPVENLEDRMCKKHDRPLELFCKTEQMCVCQFCTESDHKLHLVVPLKEEYEGKKAQLGKTGAEVQQMIQERQLKIQEIKHSVQLSKEDTDREIADSVEVFTALMSSIERSQAELIETIEEKQKSTEKKAEGLIKELEQEISKLMKRSTELEQLSHTEDHIHLLQGFPTLNTPPLTKDWTKVNVHQSYVGTVRRAVAQLEKTLNLEMKKLLEKMLNLEMKKLCEGVELKRVQQYAVDVTLDPDTAHPKLILSKDGKQVYCGDVKKNLPDKPERFSQCVGVLGKQSFSAGRFYYEVDVKGKTEWDLGVARESINRKGNITLSPKKGFWTLCLRNGNEYKALDDPRVLLSLRDKLQKVGVFVDHDEGLVSFYDVEARVHIYSYTGCTFSETLYPLFSPSLNHGGKNSAPLIISPVNHTD
ncbi:zinc finger protein RFP-like [Polymixia lowei]